MAQPHARPPVTAFAALAFVALAVQACATKGYVRTRVAEATATTEAHLAVARDSAIRAAETTRMAADQELETRVNNRMDAQIAALRTELQTLRNEFNTRITFMEDSLKFAVPVQFGFDDASVRETDKPVLDRFAQIVKKYYPDSRITIEGFADPAGSASYNRVLSKRRADAVQAHLVSSGVSSTQLMTVGYGETRLMAPSASKGDPGAELNRRVVFAIETMNSPMKAVALVFDRE